MLMEVFALSKPLSIETALVPLPVEPSIQYIQKQHITYKSKVVSSQLQKKSRYYFTSVDKAALGLNSNLGFIVASFIDKN